MSAFNEAAQAFLDCRWSETVGQPELDLQKVYLRLAAECQTDAEEHLEAAKTFVRAGCFTSAAENYCYVQKFEEMVELLKNHDDEVDRGVAKRLMVNAKLFYLRVCHISYPVSSTNYSVARNTS
jgi:hypothetical protein